MIKETGGKTWNDLYLNINAMKHTAVMKTAIFFFTEHFVTIFFIFFIFFLRSANDGRLRFLNFRGLTRSQVYFGNSLIGINIQKCMEKNLYNDE